MVAMKPATPMKTPMTRMHNWIQLILGGARTLESRRKWEKCGVKRKNDFKATWHIAPRCRHCTFPEGFSTQRCLPQRFLAPRPGSPFIFSRYFPVIWNDLVSPYLPLGELGNKNLSAQSPNCHRTEQVCVIKGSLFSRNVIIVNSESSSPGPIKWYW